MILQHYADFKELSRKRIIESHLAANARIRELEEENFNRFSAESFLWYRRWELEATACGEAEDRADRLAVVADALAVECKRLRATRRPMRVLEMMDAIERNYEEIQKANQRADRAEDRLRELAGFVDEVMQDETCKAAKGE